MMKYQILVKSKPIRLRGTRPLSEIADLPVLADRVTEYAKLLEYLLTHISPPATTDKSFQARLREHEDTFSDYAEIQSARSVRNRITHPRPDELQPSQIELRVAECAFKQAIEDILSIHPVLRTAVTRRNRAPEWKDLDALLRDRGEVDEEFLEQEFGLTQTQMALFLTETLRAIGYWDQFELAVEEAGADGYDTEHLIRAVNAFWELYIAKEDFPLPQGFRLIRRIEGTKGGYLAFDDNSKHHFVGIFGGRKRAIALPQLVDINDSRAQALAVEALTRLVDEGKFKICVSLIGDMNGNLNNAFLEVRMGDAVRRLTWLEFGDNDRIRKDFRDKPEEKTLFRLLILQRLDKYNRMQESEMSAEDTRQCALVRKTVLKMLETPLTNELSYAEQVRRSALEARMVVLKRATKR